MSMDRFLTAQDRPQAGYGDALAEIRAGRKRGHWIWYVFPQLSGLGMSSQSQRYGIRGVAEAREYLRDPVLRRRLLEISTAVSEQLRKGVSVETLMGSSIDAVKLVSSMTLFGGVARHLPPEGLSNDCKRLAALADEILTVAAAEGYPRCARTLEELKKE